MINKKVLKDLGLKVHLLHDWAYTFWKVWETGVTLREPLTPQERKFFLKFWPILKNGANKSVIAYDIGASIGIVSGCLAKISQIAAVHAFEPIPGSFKTLTARMQPYPHVMCHNVALGDANQRQKMWVMDKSRNASSFLNMGDLNKQEFSGSFESHTEDLPIVRLDDYVREHQLPPPDLVKIDVQGFEDRVLRGGEETIRQAAYCMLEMSFRPLYEGSPIFDHVYRQMRELGFRLIGIEDILKGVSGTHLQIDRVFENEKLISLDHIS
jgi:FkbM family methyltransferase